MPRGRRGKRVAVVEASPEKKSRRSRSSHDDDDDDDDDSRQDHSMRFTQQAPELSQPLRSIIPSEQKNLEKMKPEQREKVLMDLTRLILFKTLAGDPIDRLKCCKEAGIMDQGKISTAAFAEAADRLQNVFGFSLKRFPTWMEGMKGMPVRFKERVYVINDAITEEVSPDHSKAIHSLHIESSVEKGLLMVILALAFCAGEPRSDGSRWIFDADLYRMMHQLDENIDSEPPSQSRVKNKASRSSVADDLVTPEVDRLLEKFVRMDYIMKEKITEEDRIQLHPDAEEKSFFYALGPRAGLEIGRRQVIFFCAEILDEEPDPTMLMELQRDEELEEEMECSQ